MKIYKGPGKDPNGKRYHIHGREDLILYRYSSSQGKFHF